MLEESPKPNYQGGWNKQWRWKMTENVREKAMGFLSQIDIKVT